VWGLVGTLLTLMGFAWAFVAGQKRKRERAKEKEQSAASPALAGILAEKKAKKLVL